MYEYLRILVRNRFFVIGIFDFLLLLLTEINLGEGLCNAAAEWLDPETALKPRLKRRTDQSNKTCVQLI